MLKKAASATPPPTAQIENLPCVSVEARSSFAYWRETIARAHDVASLTEIGAGLVAELEELHEWAAWRSIELPLFRASRAEALARGWLNPEPWDAAQQAADAKTHVLLPFAVPARREQSARPAVS